MTPWRAVVMAALVGPAACDQDVNVGSRAPSGSLVTGSSSAPSSSGGASSAASGTRTCTADAECPPGQGCVAGTCMSSSSSSGSVGVPALCTFSEVQSFGVVEVGTESVRQVRVRSCGTAPTTLALSLSDDTSTSYDLLGAGLPPSLEPGQDLFVPVRFRPAVTGWHLGTLNLRGSGEATATVSLSAEGADCGDPLWVSYSVCQHGYDCDLFAGGCDTSVASCYPPDDSTSHGTCQPAGSAGEGQPCVFLGWFEETACRSNLRCDTTVLDATGRCRSVCTSGAACPAGWSCLTPSAGDGFGFCEPTSACVIDETGACMGGTHCVATESGGVVSTACVPDGAGDEGDTCTTSAACSAGLTCAAVTGWSTAPGEESHWYFTVDETYLVRGGVCVSLCAAGDWSRSTCDVGELCHQVSNGAGQPSGIGACFAPRS